MPLVCPACRKIYLKAQADPETGLEIDVCPKCYGMWFDTHELSKFFESDRLKTRFFLEEDVVPDQSVGYVMTTTRRTCPRCKSKMEEKLFGNVSIDICRQCSGLWLDDGELRRIVHQYEKGARNEETVAGELSAGIDGTAQRPSFSNIMENVMKFFKLTK